MCTNSAALMFISQRVWIYLTFHTLFNHFPSSEGENEGNFLWARLIKQSSNCKRQIWAGVIGVDEEGVVHVNDRHVVGRLDKIFDGMKCCIQVNEFDQGTGKN